MGTKSMQWREILEKAPVPHNPERCCVLCLGDLLFSEQPTLSTPSVFIVWAVDLLTGEDNHRAHPIILKTYASRHRLLAVCNLALIHRANPFTMLCFTAHVTYYQLYIPSQISGRLQQAKEYLTGYYLVVFKNHLTFNCYFVFVSCRLTYSYFMLVHANRFSLNLEDSPFLDSFLTSSQ